MATLAAASNASWILDVGFRPFRLRMCLLTQYHSSATGHVLHNQSALRFKSSLLFEPGVMVTCVPWRLSSSTGRNLRRVERSPGGIRMEEGKLCLLVMIGWAPTAARSSSR
jgi:hypothetical protein